VYCIVPVNDLKPHRNRCLCRYPAGTVIASLLPDTVSDRTGIGIILTITAPKACIGTGNSFESSPVPVNVSVPYISVIGYCLVLVSELPISKVLQSVSYCCGKDIVSYRYRYRKLTRFYRVNKYIILYLAGHSLSAQLSCAAANVLVGGQVSLPKTVSPFPCFFNSSW